MRKYKPLLEGRKQAIQILKKTYGKNSIKIVNELEKLDPTRPKNKYLELFARFVLESYPEDIDNDVDIIIRGMKGMFLVDNLINNIEKIEKRNQTIDLHKLKDYASFKKEVNKLANKVTKSYAKGGIKGLKEGEDFFTLKSNSSMVDSAVAYVPLNFDASVKIASQSTGTCKGFWCTADIEQYKDRYWKEYGRKGAIFVYIVDYSGTINKWAIAIIDDRTEIFNYKDNVVSEKDFESLTGFNIREIVDEVSKKEKKIRSVLEFSSGGEGLLGLFRDYFEADWYVDDIYDIFGTDVEEVLEQTGSDINSIIKLEYDGDLTIEGIGGGQIIITQNIDWVIGDIVDGLVEGEADYYSREAGIEELAGVLNNGEVQRTLIKLINDNLQDFSDPPERCTLKREIYDAEGIDLINIAFNKVKVPNDFFESNTYVDYDIISQRLENNVSEDIQAWGGDYYYQTSSGNIAMGLF